MSEVDLRDSILRGALLLQLLANAKSKEADAILLKLANDLKMLLGSHTLSEAGRANINQLLKQADEAIQPAYAEAAEVVDTHALSLVVADKTVAAIEDVLPVNIATPTAQRLASLTKDVLIDGAPSSAWWSKQADDTAFKFSAAVRQGVVNGETNEQIVARVTGPAGEPGILDVARRNARTLVHSSVMAAANDARLATFRKNSRFIAGVRWLSTLDSHTCWTADTLIRMADGTEKPIGEVREGEFVIGGVSGEPKRVLATMKRVAQSSVVIHCDGRYVGRATEDHPILTPQGWREIGSVSLSADVSEREVLCRHNKASELSPSPARNGSRAGEAIRPLVCMAHARTADDDDHREGDELRDSVRDGDGANQATEYVGSERLQHDSGRRRLQRHRTGNTGEDGAPAFTSLLGRRRVQGDDAGSAAPWSEEGRSDPSCMVSDTGRAGLHRSSVEQPGVARSYGQECTRAGKGPGVPRIEPAADHKAVDRSRAARKDECGSRSSTSRTAERPGVEGGQGCKDGREHAPQVGGPGVSGEDGHSEGASTFSRIESSCSGEKAGDDEGSAFSECGEILGEAESVSVGRLSAILIIGPVAVYNLTVDEDHTYVAGGIIAHNCLQCAALDGQSWDLDGAKLTGTKIDFTAPPAHFSCRCVLSPIPKSLAEFGLTAPEGQRASSEGPVPSTTTFADFLKRQSPAFVDKVLGKRRAELFLENRLTLTDLVTGSGRELSLEELGQASH